MDDEDFGELSDEEPEMTEDVQQGYLQESVDHFPVSANYQSGLNGLGEDEESVKYEYSDDDLCSNECDSEIEEEVNRQKLFTPKERVEMIHLRVYLNKINAKVDGKQYLVDKFREELKKCKSHLEDLAQEEQVALTTMQKGNEEENMALVFRIRAQINRIVQERDGEEALEARINENLENAEHELTLAKIEQGKYLLADRKLTEKEADYAAFQEDMAAFREMKEKKFADDTDKFLRRREMAAKQAEKSRLMYEKLTKQKIKEAHDKHNISLKQTMRSIRDQKAREEDEYRKDMEKKIKSVLKLKGDITKNRENLTALQARDRAVVRKAETGEQAFHDSVLTVGGNADVALLREKRLAEHRTEKQLFKIDQTQKKADIVARLVQEDDFMQKKMKRLPYLFETSESERAKRVKPHRKRKLQMVRHIEQELDSLTVGSHEYSQSQELKESAEFDNAESSDEGNVGDESDRLRDRLLQSDRPDAQVNMAKPEFEGLWDKHKDYTIPQGEVQPIIKHPNASKMDQDIMRHVLDRTRANIVTTQVAAGREFQGQPFYSKPDVIHFKDFEVGQVYKKKVILTNVSYTLNYCKLIGLTEHLKDFVELVFNPPGQLSAGMTCDLFVTFSPKINKDLIGEIEFLSQTGPFSIPIQCTTKKCDLSVDRHSIDFGTTVIGETLHQYVTLRNNGAKGTKFEFSKYNRLKERDTETETVTTWTERSQKEDGTDQKAVETQTGAAETQKSDTQMDSAAAETVNGSVEDAPDDDVEMQDAEVESEKPIDPEEYEDEDEGARVGSVTCGEIGPYSEVRLELIWSPTLPDKMADEFLLVFEDPDSDDILITTEGRAIDVPVWVDRQTVDLRICMYDRLYQDTILVHNRASTALRLKFDVHPSLANHMELLPKTGYIQAKSSFNAQLKFVPRSTLQSDAGDLFDPETGVLEVPMIIRVADQTRPVLFTVTAVVTVSDIKFDVTDLDFGHTTIYESTTHTIRVSNLSILPQKFGFVGLPEYVEVQPNDGFGILLPLETREMDVVFSPPKAKDYSFTLTLKNLINRSFTIPCVGVGVHPPMELSEQVIHFKSTALHDVSEASFYVINNHTSTNQYTHPVPRIGTGEIAPVGPTSFEFVLPPDAPLTIAPAVGTVEPGKRCHILVRFTPKLSVVDIQAEASRLIKVRLEAEAQAEYEAYLLEQKQLEEEAEKKAAAGGRAAAKPPPKGKSPPAVGKGAKGGKGAPVVLEVNLADGPRCVEAPVPETIAVDSDDYNTGQASLMRQFPGAFASYDIPCFVATGPCPVDPGTLPYSPHNTLHLTVHCPAKMPQLQVISNNLRQTTDFGEVCVGQQNVLRHITVQNITSEVQHLTSSVLDPLGPFLIMNALRSLQPRASHTVIVSFTPTAEQIYHEVLYLCTGATRLALTLTGRGVVPKIKFSNVPDGLFDMGAVIVGEYLERAFRIDNMSSLAIDFSVKLDSTSLLRYTNSQHLPKFVQPENESNSLVGVQNLNGQAVFDCVPCKGRIEAEDFVEITVTFAPDHPSDFYSDGARIELFNQEESHVFRIIGEAKPHIMYVCGGDEILPNVESLAIEAATEEDEDPKAPVESLLLTFGAVTQEDGSMKPATRNVFMGCVRTMAVSQKKNGEFVFESTNVISALGFSVDPQKGQVEAGQKRPVTFQWSPPRGHDPNKIVESSIIVTVKNDVSENYKILLRAMVASDNTAVKNDEILDQPDPIP